MVTSIKSKNLIFFTKTFQQPLILVPILVSNCKFWGKIIQKWLLWPKNVITQILQSLYNIISTLAVEELLELLKTYQDSALQHERDVFNYVIKNTFRNFSKFVLDDLRNPKYTEIQRAVWWLYCGDVLKPIMYTPTF